MFDFEVSIGSWIINGEITDLTIVPPHKGSPHTCDSDLDYYGYTDMDYLITRLENEDTLEVLEGENLDVPKDVDENVLWQDILNQYGESRDE